ncbi:MAG: mechanosensitive ion channel family protein [Planctomycetota bacterium]
MSELMEPVKEWAAQQGPNVIWSVVSTILIFLVGRVVAKVVRRIVQRVMERAKAAPILVSFAGQLTYVGLMIFVVVAALSRLGVEATSFIAVLGATALAVGFALQGSLSNFAAGILLVIFRPFRIGHFIEGAGEKGTVEDIQLFTTRIVTPDNRTVIIPNAKLTGDNVVNYSARGTRRVDLVVGIDYGADVAEARKAIEDVLAKDDRVLREPPPTVAVLDLGDSSVNLAVRPWTNTDDYWDVYFDTLESVKKRLDAEGIGIPFPQRDVHLYRHQEAAPSNL